MKAQSIIQIQSIGDKVHLTVHNGTRQRTKRKFSSIDEAIAFALPLGGRNSILLLNGFEVVLNAWTD